MKPSLMKPTSLYTDARKRLEDLKRVKKILEERLSNTLPGKIHIVSAGEKISYYHRTEPSDPSGRYISKKEQGTIRKLLQKSYDEKALKLVEQEIQGIEKLLRNAANYPENIKDIYNTYPERARAEITFLDIPDDEYARRWDSLSYEKKPIAQGISLFITDKGDQVRSKTELNIANELYKRGIPYKYECPLQLQGELTIYPDFTILDMHKRKMVYWEHRGMMDDKDYARRAVKRLKEYHLNNIFLGDNLIITEEVSSIPLGTNEIRRVVGHYFRA